MRTLLFCFLTIVFAVTLTALAVADEKEGRTLTFVADDWCPYNCAPDSDHPGYIVEILKAAYERHGYKVEYKNVPWTRAIEEVMSGKYTGLLSTSVTNTPDLIFPGVAQGAYGEAASSTFYVRAGDPWRYNGVKSMEGRMLGMIADYLYGEEFDKYVADNAKDMRRVQIVAGSGTALESNIRKLVAGRVDMIVEDPFVIGWFLSQHPDLQGKIEAAGNLGDGDDPVYVGFSPNIPDAQKLAQILTDEMLAMRDNGELQKIFARYGIEEFKLQETAAKPQ